MKTDWEIREELRKENLHFRKLWSIYAAMNRRVAEQKQKEGCALMKRLKGEMHQMILGYRENHPET